MALDAKVYRVLIASPSDVPIERTAARDLLNEWTSWNVEQTRAVLLPSMWELHTVPEMGERPQAIVNRQIVDQADALIGIFWTRIGTPTGIAESGSAEEIARFIESKKPAMLYFSSRPVVPDNLDISQWERLKDFRRKCEAQGLIDTFSSVEELRIKLSRHVAKLAERLTGIVDRFGDEIIPKGGAQYQVLQRGPGGKLIWDWVRAH